MSGFVKFYYSLVSLSLVSLNSLLCLEIALIGSKPTIIVVGYYSNVEYQFCVCIGIYINCEDIWHYLQLSTHLYTQNSNETEYHYDTQDTVMRCE